MKRGSTTVFNRKKIQEKLSLFKKSDKALNKFRNNKVNLYENPNNIIKEESKEMEINNEEIKDSYKPLKKLQGKSDIFGFQSGDENADNEGSDNNDNDSCEFIKSQEIDNYNQQPKKDSEVELEDNSDLKIKAKNILK